jgi:hypothetical protein
MSNIKVDDQWKTPTSVYVKVGGAWKIAAQTYSKIDGVWKETTLSSPPAKPILNWHSTGRFRIANYDSSLVYEASFVSPVVPYDEMPTSGTASLDISTGIYTLSGANSSFNVVARYAVGALPSDISYMERKARTTKQVLVGYNTFCCEPVENRVATCNTNPFDPSYGGAACPSWCPCYDGSQNRCICWSYGEPPILCYRVCEDFNSPIYSYPDDTKWGSAPYFYTDRGTEWSKEL